jgi:hypothetical protein
MADKFHDRFQIKMPTEEALRRFVNRAHNELLQSGACWVNGQGGWVEAVQALATHLGEPYEPGAGYRIATLEGYTKRDFARTLEALEGLTRAVPDKRIGRIISEILDMAEIDLGVRWDGIRFLPSGAKLLDEKLINDSLQWLKEKGYPTVLEPLEKALGHLLRARSHPELLSDVVTDAYEAQEALAKIVAGKDQTLDMNQELFLAKICASDEYKQILNECLKRYRPFAHSFRHGTATPAKKPSIEYAEAESFVYLTGVFIRLAISTTSPVSTSASIP